VGKAILAENEKTLEKIRADAKKST